MTERLWYRLANCVIFVILLILLLAFLPFAGHAQDFSHVKKNGVEVLRPNYPFTEFNLNGVDFTVVTGTGALVLANSPALVTPFVNGTQITSVTGTGAMVLANSPTIATPNLTGTIAVDSLQQRTANTVFSIIDNLGVTHFFISNTSPYTNTFLSGNGSGTVFLGSAARASADDVSGMINSFTGYRQNNTAGSGHVLRGNGTNFVDAALASTDLSDTASVAMLTTAQTFTNKRVTQRVVSLSDATSFTLSGDTADMNTQANTQATGTLTANAPSGTPTDGQKLIFRIKSTNVQTYAWNAAFRGSTSVPLPTASTGGGKTDYVGFIWNAADSKWDCVAVDAGH